MMSWWMVLGGTLLAALSFGAGSWRSGRALDDAYDQGWRASDREAWRDGYEAGCDDTEASMVPAGREETLGQADGRRPAGSREQLAPSDGQGPPPSTADGTYAGRADEPRPLAAAIEPNGSRLMNDHQVRAELAALAEDVPRAERDLSPHSGDGLTGVRLPAASETGPGHPASAITDTHWTRLVGREFFDEQRAWSEDLDWRLLTWAVGLMGKEGAGKMLEAAR